MKKNIFDTIIKQLFHVSQKALIDLLNALYQDTISYDAKIEYGSNEFQKRNLDGLLGDMFLNVHENDKIRRFHAEFQTVHDDRTMILRMFEYGYHKALELLDYDDDPIKVKLPKQRVIFLEKNKNIPDELEMILELDDGREIKYIVPVIKYGEYDILELSKHNLYVLLPLYIIKLRREFENINRSRSRTKKEKTVLTRAKFKELLKIISDILEIMKELANSGKITFEDYGVMAAAMANLNDYLYKRYDRYGDIDKEVKSMIKTFYDPVLVAKAKSEGQIEGKIEGKIEGIGNSIIELLKEKGTLRDELCDIIASQNKEEILLNWLRLAAKVTRIEEFEEKIQKGSK